MITKMPYAIVDICLYTPIVALNVDLKVLLQNLWMKLLLPTPESPTNTTLNTLVGTGASPNNWNENTSMS